MLRDEMSYRCGFARGTTTNHDQVLVFLKVLKEYMAHLKPRGLV